jgi:putative ABC transport system permease protein
MYRATLKSLTSRKLRLILSALAVVLGVMFVSGSFVLTDSLGKSFDNLFASINTSVDVQVMAKQKLDSDAGIGTLVGTADVEKIRAVPGVQKAAPGVFADGARIIGKDGKVVSTFGAPRFGFNWSGEDDLVQLRTGHGPASADEIVIDAALAKTSGYHVGDKIGVLTLEPKKVFTLVGIFGYSGNRDSLGNAQMIGFTMPTAQKLMLGKTDSYTQVDVTAAKGVSDAELRDRIRTALGSGFDVKTGKEVSDSQTDQIKEGLSFFNYILLGFAGVALFVGIFLILNTFSMLVAQRTRELALMRAMGASRGQVIGSVMLEATVIGLIASVLGLAAGIGVGALLAKLFSGGLQLVVGIPPAAVISAFVVGLGVTLIAALAPALRASRIPPVAAMRDAATPDKPLTVITSIGGGIFAAGAALTGVGLAGKGGGATLWLLLLGVVLSFIGVALLTPIISRPVVSVLGRVFSWSVPGQLGRRNSARNPRRTAITAAALMVSIALVTGVSTIIASARSSIDEAVQKTVQADLVISGQQTGPIPPTFDASVLTKARALPGVAKVAGFYQAAGEVDGEQTYLGAVDDLASVRQIMGLQATSGSLDSQTDRQVVVDERTAKDHKLSTGDTITIQLPRGTASRYTISGIYKRSDTMNGYLLPQSATKDFLPPSPSLALIQLRDGAQLSTVKADLDQLVRDSPEVSVQDRSEYVKQSTQIFDFILAMIQILLALAILIAILGIINTLALSVIERTRELGLLRAIGLGRSQTMRMIMVESVVITVFGAVLGIVVGIGLGAAVVQALKKQGFTTLALPWTQMVTYLALSAIIGVIAAILPAIRAARLNVLAAISYE